MRHEQSINTPVKEVVMWQPKVEGRTRDVPIAVYHHPDALKPGETQLHFYPGMGEESYVTPRGVKYLGEELDLPAVGVVLRFDKLPPTEANLERTIVEAPQHIAEELNKKAGNAADEPIDIYGRSQGGGTALYTSMNAPEKYRAIASEMSPGFNKKALGETPKERGQEFIKRMKTNNKLIGNRIFRDKNKQIAKEVYGRVLKDALSVNLQRPFTRLHKKLYFAFDREITDEENLEKFKHLIATHDTLLVWHEDDPAFPPKETISTLEEAGVNTDVVKITPGSHASSGNEAGFKQIEVVGQWLTDIRAHREL